jgi:hypothetical protein
LETALKADAHRPKHARRTGKALFVQIQAKGYRGGYSGVTDFIRAWRQESGKPPVKAFVPLSFELGEAFQFDWSDEGLMVGGVFYKVQVAHLKLCASRAFWLVAYPSQGHEMLFDAHTRSFQALGGVARRGIYDNMKTAVDKVKRARVASSTPALPPCAAITCSMRTSATWPLAGRKAWWRRTCKTAAGASGSRPGHAALARSSSSTPGWVSAAAAIWADTQNTPSTSSSRWPRCWSWSVSTS